MHHAPAWNPRMCELGRTFKGHLVQLPLEQAAQKQSQSKGSLVLSFPLPLSQLEKNKENTFFTDVSEDTSPLPG